MDNPVDRNRSRSKDPLKSKGRSRSANTFKNSPFYEKFMFFENVNVSGSCAPANVGTSYKASDVVKRYNHQTSLDQRIRGQPSARYVGCQPGTNQQALLNISTITPSDSASKHSFSFGRLHASPDGGCQRYSQHNRVHPQQHLRATNPTPVSKSIRSDTYMSNSLRELKPSHHVSVPTKHSHRQPKYSSFKMSESDSFPPSTTADTTVTRTDFSDKADQLPGELSSDSTQIRHLACSPFHDTHSDDNYLKTTADESSINELLLHTLDHDPRLTDNVSLRRSISACDLFECTKNEEVSSTSYLTDTPIDVQAVSVASAIPQSKNSHLNISENSQATAVRAISTISITLKNSISTQQKTDRKIHVIETRHSKPYIAPDTSPRLDEWLSSVMKLQKERMHTDHWAFPEDEHIVSTPYSSIDPTCLQNTDRITLSNSVLDISPLADDSGGVKPTYKSCSSKGVNTDVSFAVEKVLPDETTCNDLDIFSTISHAERQINECENNIFEYSSSPSTHCSHCCTYREDQNRLDVSASKVKVSTVDAKPYEPTMHARQRFQSADFAENENKSIINDQIKKLRSTSKPLQTRHNSLVNTDINKPDAKMKNSNSEYHKSGITIQVTGEEDRGLAATKLLLNPKQRGNIASVSRSSDQGFRCIHDASTERTFAMRGASPHYMFPCNHPTWEEDDVHRYLMSPRNSVGSISSIMSYKSSNADSAVDMCPPDDDQDLEYADFLDKHQSRRFSHTNENLSLIEKQAVDDSLLAEQLGRFSNVDQTVHGHYSTYHRSSFHSPQTKSSRGLSESSYFSIQNQQEEQSLEDVGAKANDSEVLTKLLGLSKDRVAIRHSDIESAGSYVHFPLRIDDMNSSSKSESGSVLYKRITSIGYALDEDSHIKSFQKSNALGKVVKSTSIPEPADDSDFQKQYPQNPITDLYKEQPRLHIIPELIISDHSDTRNSRENSPTFQLGARDTGLDSPLPSRQGSSLDSSEDELVDAEEGGFLRSVSMSSLCSIASTCSTCTAVSVSDLEVPVKRQSSWKKIRSFILWSPFIQVFKKHRYPWIQLAGHQGNFHAGEAGSVLKKLDTREQASFEKLMTDTLKDFVPEYRGDVDKNGETYIQLQDLLCSFSHPCVMDVKMGVRTYLEDELQKARRSPTLRKDMYQKMIEIDCTAPTSEEHEQKAVTKPRYMQWRDEMSSSVEFGFRVEGVKKSDGNSSKDFKKTKTRDNIVDIMRSFVGIKDNIVTKYINRLKELIKTQESSEFFQSHEIIGSSLLFVHDADENVGVWMIDFGKSEPLPRGVKIDHRRTWIEGNHEDGYLFGLDNLVAVLEEVQRSLISSSV